MSHVPKDAPLAFGGQRAVDRPARETPLAAVLRQEHARRHLWDALAVQVKTEGGLYGGPRWR
jgi:hypothetical protein